MLSAHGTRTAWAWPMRSSRGRIPFAQNKIEQNAPQRATEIVRKAKRHMAFGGHKRLGSISASQKPAAFALPGFCPRPRSSRASEFRSPHAARGLPSAASTADRNRALQASLQRAGRAKAASDPIPQRPSPQAAPGGPAPLAGRLGRRWSCSRRRPPQHRDEQAHGARGQGQAQQGEEGAPKLSRPSEVLAPPARRRAAEKPPSPSRLPLKSRAPSQAHASFRRKGGGEGERPAPQLRTLGL